ncbi:MAG: HlyD family efflux transporter periplasmic adaptor subunit [Gammaproteobacteria bacterium]|nr:HlyD family efflux transporter periplasmic adaptor subunit [Gammaproteobacteria bacterium]
MYKYTPQFFRSFWQQERSKSRALPFVIILITAVLLVIFKLVQPEPPVKAREEKSWTVQTHRLVDGAKSPQLELYGSVESPYTATITSIIDADVVSLQANEGDHVSWGQSLILLDDTDARLLLEDKQSSVAELEALILSEKNRYMNDLAALKLEKSLLELAQRKLAREEKTSKSNLTSQASLDAQKEALNKQKLALNSRELNITDHPARLAQLEARLNRSRALAEQAGIDLARATVTAPFDGIVLKTLVSPGERVRPGEALLEMYATDRIELRAQLPQKFISIVKQSLVQQQPFQARVKTDNATRVATLDRISGSIASDGHGVDALFIMDGDAADTLTIGDTLELILELAAIEDVFSVPVSSIYGTDRIYRVENERLVAVKVEKLGNQYRDGRQYVLVRNHSLTPGDEIITTQLPLAVNGLKVEVRNQTTSSTGLSQQLSGEEP